MSTMNNTVWHPINTEIEFKGESWKPLKAKGFEGLYFISTHGRVKNRGGEIKKAFKIRDKYIVTMLANGEKQSSFILKNLVAVHFLNNPEKLETVVNIDGDKYNNHILNLKWGTRAPVWNKGKAEVIPDDLGFKIKTLIRQHGGREALLRCLEKFNVPTGYYYDMTAIGEILPIENTNFYNSLSPKNRGNYSQDELLFELEIKGKRVS